MPHRSRKSGRSGSRRAQPARPTAADLSAGDVQSWPVVKAFVPLEEAWLATGYGTAGIHRQRPDGLMSTAHFMISVIDGGLTGVLSKPGSTPEDEEEFRRSVKHQIPPMQEGPPELAARFIWGAYTWAEEDGVEWGDDIHKSLRLVPRPPGRRQWWLTQFREQLCPRRLADIFWNNPMPDDIPEGKELAIFTTAVYHLGDPQLAIQRIKRLKPEFVQTDGGEGFAMFNYSRKYPRGHWSPLALLGGRQSLGDVTIDKHELKVQVTTLSNGAILIEKLKDQLGEQMHFKDATWIDPRTDALSGDEDDEEDEGR